MIDAFNETMNRKFNVITHVVYHINTFIKPYVDEDILSSILPTGSQPDKLYGMCKVHMGIPLKTCHFYVKVF